MSNTVFIATSLDGYIAGVKNEIEWLHSIPNPDNLDMGFEQHMAHVDALVMGRNTYELVLNLACEWPYSKPVFVLSNTLKAIPASLKDKVFIIKGELKALTKQLNTQGYRNLYIDGGITIQNFLKADLIDEMIITTIPILLGGGIALFGELDRSLEFRCVSSELFNNGIYQNRFKRHRA